MKELNLTKFNELIIITKSLSTYENEIDWKINLLSKLDNKSIGDIEDLSILDINNKVSLFSSELQNILLESNDLPKELIINDIKYISYVDEFFISAGEFKRILPIFEKDNYIIELANIIWRKEIDGKKDKNYEDNKELFSEYMGVKYIAPYIKITTNEIKNYLTENDNIR